MSILYFCNHGNETARNWQSALGTLPAGQPMRVVSDFNELTRNIAAFRNKRDVVVTFMQTEEDLERLLRMQDMMNDLFLIVICNASDNTLFNRCRLVYPRLLVRDNESANIVSAIIAKRLSN